MEIDSSKDIVTEKLQQESAQLCKRMTEAAFNGLDDPNTPNVIMVC